MFDISDTSLGAEVTPETVFRRCVETVNTRGVLGNSTLSTQIERVPATDPFHTAKRGERRITVMTPTGIREPRPDVEKG